MTDTTAMERILAVMNEEDEGRIDFYAMISEETTSTYIDRAVNIAQQIVDGQNPEAFKSIEEVARDISYLAGMALVDVKVKGLKAEQKAAVTQAAVVALIAAQALSGIASGDTKVQHSH